MSKIIATLFAGAVLAGGLLAPVDSAFAAKKNKKAERPVAAKVAKPAKGKAAGVTNIADCAKMDASQRDVCISRSAPVKGADLYKAAAAGGAAPAAAPTVTKAAKPEKPGKAQKAGATNIDDCSKMQGGDRDACISRSAPVKGDALYAKYKK